MASILGAIAQADPSPNATSKALGATFRDPGWSARRVVPFSSDRKWSAFEFRSEGAYVLGAPDVIPHEDPLIDASISTHVAAGRRVLMVAEVDELPEPTQLPLARPVGLVALGDQVRADAPATLDFFARQGVTVKVISGRSHRNRAGHRRIGRCAERIPGDRRSRSSRAGATVGLSGRPSQCVWAHHAASEAGHGSGATDPRPCRRHDR